MAGEIEAHGWWEDVYDKLRGKGAKKSPAPPVQPPKQENALAKRIMGQ